MESEPLLITPPIDNLVLKKNLVWCSVDAAKALPSIFGEEADYDIIIHNYGDKKFTEGFPPPGAQSFDIPHEEKLRVAARIITNYLYEDAYEQFAFLDDDLTIDVDTLNRLFMVGSVLRLPLYQPALTRKSHASHMHLCEIPDAIVRKVPFVEIMCPFFSRDALRACLPTFDINLSGWGIDCFLWPKKVSGCYVIDALPIGHYNPPSRRDRVQKNGKTPAQECEEIRKRCAELT